MSVRSVIFDVIARDRASAAFKSASVSAAAAATGIDRSLARVEQRSAVMMAAGARLSKAITLPVLAFAGVGAKLAVDFEKHMTLLRTAAGESETNMRQITSGIKKVSSDTATSLNDLSDGMYVVAKAAKSRGWTGAEQLNILRAAAQGAKAEQVDLGVATDALSTVMLDYHKNASSAVQVENQLIRASGLAKTNFGLFSESLSNVTPIAAATGISFDQIGGAIATMTQHGVTAQRATENLRFLIFALAGQNNVASQAMQQLGIDTVDLSQNLGKRGLSGTLGIVDRALAAHTKNGMVTTDVHKAAALATRSLNTMLGSMTGELKTQSAGLLSGKVGIKDYTAFAKSLGGQAGASALQFLALQKSSQGFSNQLKAGKGTVTTTLQQYQKMLGGMPGAAVGLQIGGKYAEDFAKNVKEVGDAAQHTGKNVHGWELTQKTLAYKLDDVKNKTALLATSVGEKLLPFLSKVADAGTKAFKWFDGLNSGAKKFIGYSLLVGAALGPLLSITGRLTRGFVLLFGFGYKAVQFARGLALANVSLATMNSGAWAAGFNMRTMFSQGISGARGMGSALAGAGIGASIGLMTRESSGATKAVGALGSAALGAAAGFAVGGPWGAAIGGGVGLLSNLAANFLGAGKSARDAIKPTDEYTNALLRSKGAIDDTIRSMVAKDIQSKGGYDAGLKIGIDQKTLTDAATGNKDAIKRVRVAQEAYTLASLKGGKDAESYKRAIAKLNGVLGDEAKTLDVNRRAARNLAAANSAAGKNDAARKTALKAVVKMQSDAAASMKKFNQQVGVHGASLDPNSKGGASNAAFLTKQVQAYNKIAAAQLRSGSSLGVVNRTLNGNIAALRAQAVEAGFSGKAIDALIGKYKQTPKQIVTDLVANIGGATASAGQLQTIIDNVKQHKVPGLDANSAQGRAVIKAIQDRIDALKQKRPTPLKANGNLLGVTAAQAQAQIDRIKQGKVPGLTADSSKGRAEITRLQGIIDALRGKTVPVTIDATLTASAQRYLRYLNASSVNASIPADSRRFTQADGGIIEFYKHGGIGSGGRERHVAQIAPAGSWRVWAEDETGGEAYIPLAKSKRKRSRKIAAETVSRLGGTAEFYAKGGTRKGKKPDQNALSSGVSSAVGGIGQAYSPPFALGDVGAARVGATIAAAAAKLRSAVSAGLSGKSAAAFRSQIANLVGLANRQLSALRLKIRGGDITALKNALKSSVDDTRTALSQLYADLKSSGVSKTVQTAIQKAGTSLVTLRNNLDKANDRLATMRDFASGIGDTLRGTFDPTQSGSVTDLLAGFSGATDSNKRYSSELSGLLNKAKGDKTLTGFINQLALSGNSATLDSLAGASKSELAQVSKAVGSYNTSVSSGVDAATIGKFGITVGQQANSAAAIQRQITLTANAVGQVAAAIGNLRIDIGGRELNNAIDTRTRKQLNNLARQLKN